MAPAFPRTLVCSVLLNALASPIQSQPAGHQVLAIAGVTVLPMDSDRELRDHTVVISSGRIAAVDTGPRAVVPAGALVIDGRGKFLIPGLHDLYAHVHEWALPQFLAAGITTVRNAAPGRLVHLALRDDVAAGRRIGPRVLSTGPVLDGIEPSYSSAGSLSTVSEARRIVRAQHKAGFDAVMAYVGIEPLPYLAVLDEARQLGIPVTGHTPWKVPRDLVIRGGQRSRDNLIGDVDTETGVAFVPEGQRDADAASTAAAGQWVIPTLTIHKMRARRDSVATLLAQPGMEWVPPRQRMHWTRAMGRLVNVPRYQYSGAPDLVARLHRAGAKVLVGTDAGFPFVVAGVSLADELANLVEVGFTPVQALRAATLHAAEFLGESSISGSIVVGKRADIVLLDADPRRDVRAVSRVAGVGLRGQWYTPWQLRAELDRLATPAANRFAGFTPLDCRAATACAQYIVQARGLTIGEERLAVYRRGQTLTRLIAQSSLDPHLATRTTMDVALAPAARLSLVREEAGLQKRVTLTWGRRGIGVRASVGGHEEAWTAAAERGMLLAGPLHGVNADADLMGTLQLVMERVATLPVGDQRLIQGFRAELNEEEHGRAGIAGETAWHVTREADGERGTRRFSLLVPGLNGSGSGRFSLTVGSDGLLERVASPDGYLVIARSP